MTDPSEPPTEPPVDEPTVSAATAGPVLVADFPAATDPESAHPGDRVVVDVIPARPDVGISGCSAGFAPEAMSAEAGGSKVWPILGRVLLGVLAFAVRFLRTPVRRRIGRLFRRGDRPPADTDGGAPEVTAVAVARPEDTVVTVEDRDVPAVHPVSVEPRIDPILHEEVP